MKKMFIMAALLVAFTTTASAADTVVHLKKPTRHQVAVITKVLGKEFVAGTEGAMGPELLALSVDLNHDGVKDLITLQKGVCSNHTCDYIVLFSDNGDWKQVADLESWADIYIESNTNGPDNLIMFDKRNSPCEACPPDPAPYRYKWSNKEDAYVETGLVKGKKLKLHYGD